MAAGTRGVPKLCSEFPDTGGSDMPEEENPDNAGENENMDTEQRASQSGHSLNEQKRLERKAIIEKLERLFESQITKTAKRNKKYSESRAVIINGLRLIKKIGTGSYGNVWKAQRLETGELVAVKKMIKTSINAQLEFLKEAEILRISDHPNVLRFLGVYVQRGDITEDISEKPNEYQPKTMKEINNWGLYLCTEYCRNGDLSSFLHNSEIRAVPWEVRMKFSLDVAKGLEYLHSQKIVHRDLKSENILLQAAVSDDESEDGDLDVEDTLNIESLFRSTAILADVGLARWFDHKGGKKRPLTIRGNPWTMAPELFGKSKTYSIECDIFSLGVVFLEIATRLKAEKLPRRTDLSLDVQKIAFLPVNPDFNPRPNEPNSRSSLNMSCPDDFLDLSLWCADPDPKNRPTAKLVVEHMKKILSNYKRSSMSRNLLV